MEGQEYGQRDMDRDREITVTATEGGRQGTGIVTDGQGQEQGQREWNKFKVPPNHMQVPPDHYKWPHATSKGHTP